MPSPDCAARAKKDRAWIPFTHLYDDRHDYLIVDEPELNLHPQYQAFFMEEVRKIAGREDAAGNAKIVFLITHSPFILDLRSDDDVKSIISFDLEYSIPRQVARKNSDVASVLVVTGRLNAHHKQLFFADDPVFVEGHHDALIVESLMEARGVSAAAAGSCIHRRVGDGGRRLVDVNSDTTIGNTGEFRGADQGGAA